MKEAGDWRGERDGLRVRAAQGTIRTDRSYTATTKEPYFLTSTYRSRVYQDATAAHKISCDLMTETSTSFFDGPAAEAVHHPSRAIQGRRLAGSH